MTEPGIGHNSEPADVGGISGKRLKSFIERIERLEEEKAELAEDIREIYGEAKGAGFDVKTIRKIIKLRKIDAEKRREDEELLDLYMAALGMLADTPLGQAAIKKATAAAEPYVQEHGSVFDDRSGDGEE